MFIKKLTLAGLILALAACQGGVNDGVSSHVTVGKQPNTPAANPAQPPAAKPKPAPAPTSVQVVAANPEEGVPLSEASQVNEDSLPVVATPVALPAPIEEAPQPAAEPEPSWLSRYPHLAENLANYEQTIQRLEEEAQQLRQQADELRQEVNNKWGAAAAPLAANSHQFVKYTDSYQSRGEMDFDEGKILVETLDQTDPKAHLKEAIVTTLLTPYDAENPEIYSDKKIDYSGPAILAGQVKDHEGQEVKWQWRAERYADYLVENQMREVNRDGQKIYQVEIPLVANHTQVRGQQYENLVRQASKQYQVDEALIYAIIETESSFNPYATSHVPAYGLMQIVPATAGKDVFTRIKKRSDQPSRDYLFRPANNIDTGTAYITILRDNYLKDIRHPLSKEYAIISGYNGGAGNVLKTFHKDRKQAVNVINQLSPQQVYARLKNNHPSAEARGYIEKVTKAKQRYTGLALKN